MEAAVTTSVQKVTSQRCVFLAFTPNPKNVISLLHVPVNATTHAYTLGQETMGCASKKQRRDPVNAAHDQRRRFWYLGYLRHE